jgi:hypothetical protein
VGVSEFIDLMLTEWYDEQDRTRFLNGLSDVDLRTKALFGKDFRRGLTRSTGRNPGVVRRENEC